MLNGEAALSYVEHIEEIRRSADEDEAAVLADLRNQPGYEQNQDKDILEAVRLRADARTALSDADTIIQAFDWVYDVASGETVRKEQSQ